MREKLNPLLYFRAVPVLVRNLGIVAAPLVAAAIGIGLQYAGGPLFAPVGGAGSGILSYVAYVIQGFGFCIALICADSAWRFGRAGVGAAWRESQRKAGPMLIAVIGFFFLVYIAELIGSIPGGVVGDYLSKALGVLAVWAFIYALPAASIGGVPGNGVFSASLSASRRHPIATAILTIVSLVVWFGVAVYAPAAAGPYLGAGYDVARILLMALAQGYIALIVARQYSDLAFRPYW